MRLTAVSTVFLLTALLGAPAAPPLRAVTLASRPHRLPTGWTCHPMGRQIPLGLFPLFSRVSPDGKYLLVLHGGVDEPSIRVFNTRTFRETDRVRLQGAWGRMAFAPGGRRLYVAGGATGGVVEYGFSGAGKLSRRRTFSILARGARLTPRDFVSDVALTPDGRLIYAACLFRDEVVVINPESGWVIDRFPTARRPYRILFAPDGKSYYVTGWADGSVHHYETVNGNQLARVRLGLQPMDMVWQSQTPEVPEGETPPAWKARLFLTTASTNRVPVLGITSSGDFVRLDSIKVPMWPWQPAGMTPSALALSKDQKRLYVVCADANVVAVVDVSRPRCRVLGFLPTGWYPTSVSTLPDGRVVVLNGRGARSYPNPNGPNPTTEPMLPYTASRSPGYIGRLERGSASILRPGDLPSLIQATKVAFELSPYNDRELVATAIPRGNPVPPGPGGPAERASPIRHVLYIVKENRTYDQVLGDLPTGNGDARLAVFGAAVTPNQHALARQFVLFDNFHVNGEVDADGRYWSTAAIAPPFIQRLWPALYGGRLKENALREGWDLAAAPPAGYLWFNAESAGLTVRNYGFLVNNYPKPRPDGRQVKSVRDPSLKKITDRAFRGLDPAYPDAERARVFIEDLQAMEKAGRMPRLMVMHLGNDQTSGTVPGKISPRSAVADNDYALGRIVDACSHSSFWPQMAIFVLEDDAQGGADHVDAHRSPAFIVSPYARRGVVDSTFYNTTSMLRTMELILGLHPMTQFDAAATPMWRAFTSRPDTKPYVAVKPKVPLGERNR